MIAREDMLVVRFADDAVLGFQKKAEAERYWNELKERMKKFDLELHPQKTRLLEFGRFAAQQRQKRGEGKPETFNYLGFTHICGKDTEGAVHGAPADDPKAHAGKAEGDPQRTAAAHA
jgi:RNA-directed DNA polymerase